MVKDALTQRVQVARGGVMFRARVTVKISAGLGLTATLIGGAGFARDLTGRHHSHLQR